MKVAAQGKIWNDLYAQQLKANALRTAKANRVAHAEQAQSEAEERTKVARETLAEIRSTLGSSLARKLSFSWDERRNYLPYAIAQPEVVYHQFPIQPQSTDSEFAPHFGLLDKLVGPLHEKKIAEAQHLYEEALASWQNDCARLGQSNDALEADYLAHIAQWKSNKQAYEQAQASARAATDLKQQRYQTGSAREVIEYNTEILERSPYPEFLEKSFDIDYHSVKQVLVVNYDLPAFADFPKLESVKYVKTKDTFTESELSSKEAAALYASFACQMCLRSIHELFDSDKAKVLTAIAFNGYVSATNPATGNVERTCVLALNTAPTAFSSLNLAKVDPQECFKSLGGRISDPLQKYRAIASAGSETNESAIVPGWIARLKQRLTEANGTVVLRINELHQLVGTIVGKRANLGDGRDLLTLLAEGGFSVEPDASLLAQSYRDTDAVAVFAPDVASDLKASPAYQGAAAVLAMCGLVAVADGQLEPQEVERTRQCVDEAFNLSTGDKQRFDALLKALLVNGDCLWRALPKVITQLKPEFKEWAVEVAVYVGIKNGTLESAERQVLDRIFQAIDLSGETQSRIIAKYTSTSPEVTVLHADPQPVGEVIAKTPGGLKLDMTRVAAIAQETREVVAKLSDIMEDKETKAELPPVVTPTTSNSPQNASTLNSHYLPILKELIAQPNWTKADFDGLAAKYKLMPVAVIDVINAWSDDALGDFLIDGEDPITIHTELQPQLP